MLKKKEKYSCRIFAKNGKQKLNINCWQLLIISIKLYNATLEPNILIVYHIFIKEEEQYFAIEADCSVERGYNSCKAGEHLSICSRSIYFLQCTVGPYIFFNAQSVHIFSSMHSRSIFFLQCTVGPYVFPKFNSRQSTVQHWLKSRVGFFRA